MLLDLSVGGEGIWAEYDEDVSFKIRFASPESIRKSRNKYVKTKMRGGVRQEIEMSKTDNEKWDADLWDMMVEDWKGVVTTDNTGKQTPLECTKVHKKLLADKSGAHANFIMDFAQDINNFVDEKQTEEELKNSKASSASK
tara:strand:- start:8960 stop:9382 length:423 start_codon:yes stop_codon:yes gene_type:complete